MKQRQTLSEEGRRTQRKPKLRSLLLKPVVTKSDQQLSI